MTVVNYLSALEEVLEKFTKLKQYSQGPINGLLLIFIFHFNLVNRKFSIHGFSCFNNFLLPASESFRFWSESC